MPGMSWDEYVDLLADLLSGEPNRVSEANKKLFSQCVTGEDATKHPSLALVDAEQKV